MDRDESTMHEALASTVRSHVGTATRSPAIHVDPDLVKVAVVRLNGVNRSHGLAWVRAMGELVVDLFFDGDLAQVRLEGRRHRSLRAVARHPELEISTSTLWYTLAIYEQLHQMPTALAHALSVSHHRRLVPVRDLTVKLRLAERAVHHRWSVRALEGEVARQRDRETADNRAGRPKLPGFVKAIRRLPRALDGGLDGLDARAVRKLGSLEARALVALLDGQLEQLEALRTGLQELIEQG